MPKHRADGQLKQFFHAVRALHLKPRTADELAEVLQSHRATVYRILAAIKKYQRGIGSTLVIRESHRDGSRSVKLYALRKDGVRAKRLRQSAAAPASGDPTPGGDHHDAH